jgi:homeodomain-containing protein
VNREMDWKKLLGSVTNSLDQELRLRNEYLLAENRLLRQQVRGRLRLTDGDRNKLAAIGQHLGRKALEEIATVIKPDTILAWNRKCAPPKCDGAKPCPSAGRPRINPEVEDLVVRMARENRSWGYDRIVGALANLGYTLSDQTVGNILKRHGLPPAPERKKTVTWREFVRVHLAILRATDFFNSEIWRGFERLITSLLCCLPFVRHQVHTVRMTLYQGVQQRLSLVLRSLDLSGRRRQRWRDMVQKIARSRGMRCGAGVLGKTAFEFILSDERLPHSHALGMIVSCLPSMLITSGMGPTGVDNAVMPCWQTTSASWHERHTVLVYEGERCRDQSRFLMSMTPP